MRDADGYILTEIWKPRPAWLSLGADERTRFFDERIGPLITSLIGEGAEILACAINDNTGTERIDFRYMAVWRLPDKAFSDRLESAALDAGFLEYFEQANFSGACITPDVMNADMIRLPA
ncbi:MAG: DUF6616 family protein [Planctomycetota bacterium]|jgi:hypothetical protein